MSLGVEFSKSQPARQVACQPVGERSVPDVTASAEPITEKYVANKFEKKIIRKLRSPLLVSFLLLTPSPSLPQPLSYVPRFRLGP